MHALIREITGDKPPDFVRCKTLYETAKEDPAFKDELYARLKQCGLVNHYSDQIIGLVMLDEKRAKKNSKYQVEAPEETKIVSAISAAALVNMKLPDLKWLVNGLLPVGLCIFCAPPKYFKSFLALQLSICVCTGSNFFGRSTDKSGVLYLDLESGKRRPRDRLIKLLESMHQDPPENLYFLTLDDDVGKIDSGFLEVVENQLIDHPDIQLIVIDVFEKVRRDQKRTQSLYHYDFEDIATLKSIADRYNSGLFVIHHTKKQSDPDDPFNNISGSTALLGAADVAWVLTRDKRNDEETTLHTTGRDIVSEELSLKFNTKKLLWEYQGTSEEVADKKEMEEYLSSPVILTIKKGVETNSGRWEVSASEIKDAGRYYGTPIFDDTRTIGVYVKKYEGLLWCEASIRTDYARSSAKNRSRKYIFTQHK